MIKMLYNRCMGIYKFGNNTYPWRIRHRSNLGQIFQEKKCILRAGKYSTFATLSTTSYLNTLGSYIILPHPLQNVMYFKYGAQEFQMQHNIMEVQTATLRIFMVYSSHSSYMLVSYLHLGHDCFLPYPFHFIKY